MTASYRLLPLDAACPDKDNGTKAGTKECFNCRWRVHRHRYTDKFLSIACRYNLKEQEEEQEEEQ